MTAKHILKKIIMEKTLHKRTNFRWNIITVFLVLVVFTSCAAKKQYSIGEEFNIVLEGEGNGGFDWNMEKIDGISVVESTDIGIKKENGFSEFSKVYTLRGNSKGIYHLKFKKIRSFQPELLLDKHIQIIKIQIKK